MNREIAWRMFAGEYNDSNLEAGGGGDRAPTYVVSPLGARVNRLFVVGVLTDVENVGTDGQPMWRARISDPTGTFHVYAGQYQPEAAAKLGKIKPPAFAAVVGKSRTYAPEPGTVYTSVRPEMVKVVDENVRDYWILDACRSLKERLAAMREAQGMDPLTKDALVTLGTSEEEADGMLAAVQHYGKADLARYSSFLAEALRYLLPEFRAFVPDEPPPAARPAKAVAKDRERSPGEDVEEQVLALIGELDKDGKGAPWDALLASAAKAGVRKETLEEAVNELLDKGLVYEPVLGRMKKI
jgi:RPA family protein